MRQFRIDDSERDRILNLHESATKRQYLNEMSYGIVQKNLGQIQGFEESEHTGKFKIISSPDKGFELNNNNYETGDIVTLTPKTTIGVPGFSGNLVFHKAPNYEFGFSVNVDGNDLKIGPTA